ncbi:pantoate--beta-alanine ligase [Prolixibacteraceae bacterium JC049]|nr:pantoate--beta-alanine ligase [Prolixibacteraceae bacterium JC049]
MELISTIADLKAALNGHRQEGRSIGFVPTMGALHQGHLSLVHQAGEKTDVVVVSIFVNPTQFNDPKDLERYPRTLENDMELLEATPCQYVFAPSVQEVYPEPDNRQFDFGDLERVMEGEHRPGHFNGVAQVVSKLFDMVEPDKAIFGEKDFQQMAIIYAMVVQLGLDVEIVPGTTVREADGLAMSSRNALLTEEHRKSAPRIYQTLSEAKKLTLSMSIEEVKGWVVAMINEDPYLCVEYFDIVDSKTLQSVDCWEDKETKVGCIAVFAGEVRLIDNITF